MHGVGRGNVEGLHIRVIQDRLVVGVAPGDTVGFSKDIRRLLLAARHSEEFTRVGVTHTVSQLFGNQACANNAPLQFVSHTRSSLQVLGVGRCPLRKEPISVSHTSVNIRNNCLSPRGR